MKIVFVCYSSSGNSLGRVHALWEVARFLGFEARIVASRNNEIWTPLRDENEFCQLLITPSLALLFRPDLIICCKAIPEVVELAEHIAARRKVPITFDIDDPDFEFVMGETRPQQALRCFSRRNPGRWLRAHRKVLRASRFASNPALAALYGNCGCVPHPKYSLNQRTPAKKSTSPLVGFIGTPRHHKGVEMIRRACRDLSLPLVITAPKPADASKNESWIGETDLASGRQLLSEVDVVPLMSSGGVMAKFQLPMKVVDALNAGKTIVGSDVPPIRWALEEGHAGIIVRQDSYSDLCSALRAASDPSVRERYFERAVRSFEDKFALPVVSQIFSDELESALQQFNY